MHVSGGGEELVCSQCNVVESSPRTNKLRATRAGGERDWYGGLTRPHPFTGDGLLFARVCVFSIGIITNLHSSYSNNLSTKRSFVHSFCNMADRDIAGVMNRYVEGRDDYLAPIFDEPHGKARLVWSVRQARSIKARSALASNLDADMQTLTPSLPVLPFPRLQHPSPLAPTQPTPPRWSTNATSTRPS
jgi:hypothetical protein